MPAELRLYRCGGKGPVVECNNGICERFYHLFRSEPAQIAAIWSGWAGGMFLGQGLEIRTLLELRDEILGFSLGLDQDVTRLVLLVRGLLQLRLIFSKNLGIGSRI